MPHDLRSRGHKKLTVLIPNPFSSLITAMKKENITEKIGNEK